MSAIASTRETLLLAERSLRHIPRIPEKLADQQMLFIVIFPLMFVSGIFVPTTGMPPVLRVIAEWNPLSSAATATRQLFGNPTGEVPDVWPQQHPVTATILWSLVFIAIFAPLAVRRYRRLAL